VFLDHCYRIFGELEVAREAVTQVEGKPRGKLRVSLPQLAVHLMEHFVAFQEHFPDITLDLDFSDRIVNLIEEGFDAAVRIGDLEDSRLTARALHGYGHRLVASPGYLAKHGTPARPAELSSHACLRYRYPTSGKLAGWPLSTRGKALSVDLPETVVTNSLDPLLTMAEAGIGIASLPDFMVAASIASGHLLPILEGCLRDQRTLCILWPAGRQPLPRIRAFVDFMSTRLGAETQAGRNAVGG
jgi:DNA-binding transcriptional LysR family regulator